MPQESTPENVQENQEPMVENKPESPSNDGLLPEIMAKKEKIN